MRTEESGRGGNRVPPLNLSEDEAKALWEMAKVAIGSEEIQHSEHYEDAESVHTKVKELVDDGE